MIVYPISISENLAAIFAPELCVLGVNIFLLHNFFLQVLDYMSQTYSNIFFFVRVLEAVIFRNLSSLQCHIVLVNVLYYVVAHQLLLKLIIIFNGLFIIDIFENSLTNLARYDFQV